VIDVYDDFYLDPMFAVSKESRGSLPAATNGTQCEQDFFLIYYKGHIDMENFANDNYGAQITAPSQVAVTSPTWTHTTADGVIKTDDPDLPGFLHANRNELITSAVSPVYTTLFRFHHPNSGSSYKFENTFLDSRLTDTYGHNKKILHPVLVQASRTKVVEEMIQDPGPTPAVAQSGRWSRANTAPQESQPVIQQRVIVLGQENQIAWKVAIKGTKKKRGTKEPVRQANGLRAVMGDFGECTSQPVVPPEGPHRNNRRSHS
jgi:hypothetical protein